MANRIAFSQGTDFDQTYRMQRADEVGVGAGQGPTRPGRRGQNLYWQGFLMGVTERVETEARLREAEARYRAMVERIPRSRTRITSARTASR